MTHWIVEPRVDPETAVAVLSRDRIANGYALADLEPPFAPYTTVAVARRDEGPPAAACQVLRGPDFTAMVAHGDPEGLDAILSAIELPDEAHIGMPADHVAVVERAFRVVRRSERLRMAVTGDTFQPLISST